MIKDNEVSTDNEGTLTTLQPFILLRGIQNKGRLMGKAKNKTGKLFNIYPSSCGIPKCFCWATAIPIK